jgi:broad specificity phosphatase PhoE
VPVIDHFRHSIRATPGEHLTHEGVQLARRVGARLGEYDFVASSEFPRAIETAIAMGYGVDRYHSMLGSLMLADTEFEWSDEIEWQTIASACRLGRIAAHAATCHADLLRTIAASLPQGGRALVISHGGVIELGVVGLLPDLDYTTWGDACERCEGVRLYFEEDRCTHAELLRLSPTPAAP